MGQAAPLPSSRVGVMGRVSGEWSEGRVVVLTMELWGTGVVQCVGDVAANPSSGLLRGPPRFRALLGHHHVSGESREGGVPVLTGEPGGMGIIRTVSDVAAHPSSGLPRVPPLRFQASRGRPPSSFSGVPSVWWGCHSGWLVVVVRKLVTARHAVWLCKDVTRGTKQNQVTSRDLTCNVQLY